MFCARHSVTVYLQVELESTKLSLQAMIKANDIKVGHQAVDCQLILTTDC